MRHSGRLVAVALLVCAVGLGVVAGTGVAAEEPGALDTANESQLQDPDGVDVDGSLTGVTGAVDVLVMLSPATGATTRGELQAHAADTQATLRSVVAATDGTRVVNEFWLTNAVLVRVDTDRVPVTALARVDGVDRLVRNVEMEALPGRPSRPAPGDEVAEGGAAPNGTTTYGLEQIDAPNAWETYGTQGEGTRIAVLDSGVDPDHPDIDLDGWATFDANGSQVDAPPQDIDPQGHGTHVSGTATGGAASGTQIGVAPGAELYHGVALRECDPACVVTVAQLVASMQWAVANDADVISMSIGVPGAVEAFVEPVRNANAVGTPVVVSSGNEGDGLALSPANVYDAVGVGAAAADRTVAGFSSGDEYDTDQFWGDTAPDDWPGSYVVPSVSGPGVSVYSAAPNGSYDNKSGTSMATPHVAGAIALAQSATDRQVDAATLQTALETTAWKPDRWPTPGWERDTRYGAGIVNVTAAIEFLRTPSATVELSPRDPAPNESVTVTVSAAVGDIESYGWAFGDGTTATGETVTHTFETAGTYEVTLTVTDTGGASDTTSRQVEVAPRPFETRWAQGVGAPTRGGATVVGDSVFVGGIDGHALNLTTGEQTILPTRGPVWNAPTVVDGSVYFGTAGGENRVYAYDADAGTLAWRVRTGGAVRASPTVAVGTVYAGSDDGRVYALDAETGAERWRVDTGGPVRGSATVVETHPGPDRGAWTVFVGSDDGHVYALDASTGGIRWTVDTAASVRGSPTVADGTVYVGSDDGTVRALSARTGQQEWVVETGGPVRAAPTVSAGRVYVGGDDTSVYALDAATGAEVWRAETGGLVRGGPTVANGTVYLGTTDTNLYALDASTGQLRWTDSLFAEIHTAPTVVNGTVFVGTDRRVHAIDTEHDATSAGSRVALGTLGHGQRWADQAPTALFTLGSTPLVTGDPVTLDATASVGDIESHTWTLGDGTTATGETTTHTFTTPGEYDVTLTVEDGDRTANQTVTVSAASTVPPVIGSDPPRDPSGDGRYEDVDGDGRVGIADVQALFDKLDSDPVQTYAWAFDFDDDGRVSVFDVQALFLGST